MSRLAKWNVFSAREDFVAAVVFVPLRNRRVLVHMFNDIAPANTGIVRTETDLAFLCAIRNNAHLGAAEVVIEQILKPHSRNEEEVPSI